MGQVLALEFLNELKPSAEYSPANIIGSCGIIDIFDLIVFNGISLVHIPSMMILPSTSASRNNAVIMEDLPAPVRPTIPTFSLGLILNDKLLRTYGSLVAYLKQSARFINHQSTLFFIFMIFPEQMCFSQVCPCPLSFAAHKHHFLQVLLTLFKAFYYYIKLACLRALNYRII